MHIRNVLSKRVHLLECQIDPSRLIQKLCSGEARISPLEVIGDVFARRNAIAALGLKVAFEVRCLHDLSSEVSKLTESLVCLGICHCF